MATCSALTVELKARWWVIPYLNSVVLVSQLTGLEPDIEKVVGLIVRRGIKLKVRKW